ncbi:DUF5682 family protein [Kibdelosporangium philippinense]|uniref:DUF5682 family protein n=3 Tax=Kibdelosporangium philippinense TaxID=211113 RepID=A0ABS8Z7H7_9PSEU|nr:DUF5682 family protein [Kibdelosporangium philippinense]MCE7003833.1 DUF5682 family protein [Kibdelosporangium philippinense]
MNTTFIGVRHHSPACARLVAETIERLNPAYVLIEGPADVNDRLDELLLGHELPIAIFSYDDGHASWTPFCDYSPEWVALTVGRACGADVRFIDLPAWHPAFAWRSNRYADAELRYAEVTERLCREFAADNVDTLWDQMFEADPDDIAERLAQYFDLVRGAASADEGDAEREEYMARWIRAAAHDAGDRPVVVVTGGFHTPALKSLTTSGGVDWPEVPRSSGMSYLVPYSHQRLDAFTGYQSGMPSPEYYHRVWTDGLAKAADGLVESVVERLRGLKQPVSTADLIAARTLATGLARLRGHVYPARTDVLDGLVSALVAEDLSQPPPWTRRGPLLPGAHPALVQMVAALSGERVGTLHPETPAPPLVTAVLEELRTLELDGKGEVRLALTDPDGMVRSRVLHRLRVLQVPGFRRLAGPLSGADPVLDERWRLTPCEERVGALIEAAQYGGTLAEAAGGALERRIPKASIADLTGILFDAALCGITTLSGDVISTLAKRVQDASEVEVLGVVLAGVLGLWRHDRLFGTAQDPVLGAVIDASTARILWLVEGLHSGPAPADDGRLRALIATRDAVVHAQSVLSMQRTDVQGVARRIASDAAAPPDLRGHLILVRQECLLWVDRFARFGWIPRSGCGSLC